MSAPETVDAETGRNILRIEHALATLRCSLTSGDMLTARYAAAAITCYGDKVENALLAIEADARALAAGIITIRGV